MKRLRVDPSTVSRYQQVVAERDSKPKKECEPLTARRLSGGGRRPALKDKEEELEQWVMNLRECADKIAVSEMMIQKHARAQYGIKASNKWVKGFMRRRGLSLRLRTTDKEVNTERMQTIAREYRNMQAALLCTHSHALLFNMDETPIYLDAPANRTVDRVGAKTVEIGTTKC
jgi:hypothetical protein